MLVFLLLTVALYDMEDEGCGNGNMHYDACGKNWNDKLPNLNARDFSFTPLLPQCELKCN